jgi:hypothetical protein
MERMVRAFGVGEELELWLWWFSVVVRRRKYGKKGRPWGI